MGLGHRNGTFNFAKFFKNILPLRYSYIEAFHRHNLLIFFFLAVEHHDTSFARVTPDTLAGHAYQKSLVITGVAGLSVYLVFLHGQLHG